MTIDLIVMLLLAIIDDVIVKSTIRSLFSTRLNEYNGVVLFKISEPSQMKLYDDKYSDQLFLEL